MLCYFFSILSLFLNSFIVRVCISDQWYRFGNYIGEADSDEEQTDQVPEAFKFDEAFDDDEEEKDVNHQQLMEVDGKVAMLHFNCRCVG